MRYIWIWMLLGIDTIWLVLSIVDIIKTIRYVKVKEYVQDDDIGVFVCCVVEHLEQPTINFVALHTFVLFIISLITWIKFKIGGAE